MTRPLSEQIAEKQMRLEQTENQLKQLQQKQKENDRKARTRRLIERGALLESMIDGGTTLTNEQIKAILAVALGTEQARQFIVAMHAGQSKTALAQRDPGA